MLGMCVQTVLVFQQLRHSAVQGVCVCVCKCVWEWVVLLLLLRPVVVVVEEGVCLCVSFGAMELRVASCAYVYCHYSVWGVRLLL